MRLFLGVALPVCLLCLIILALINLGKDGGVQEDTPFSKIEDLPRLEENARTRDTFSCSRALLILAKHHPDAATGRRFVQWCCDPPIDDMGGIAKTQCPALKTKYR